MEDHVTPEGDDVLLVEEREKYSDKDREAMAKAGTAMPDGSFPIADAEDLHNAIHAVGRGNASHDAIRKHIIARAHALGLSDQIPDNWNTDGSLKQQNKALLAAAERRRKERRRAVPLMPEVRRLNASDLEVRDAGGSGDTVQVVGMPIVYDTPYTVTDRYGEFEERMSPGVASKVLPTADVRFLVDHEPGKLLARTPGSLRFTDTAEGLEMEATIDLRDSDARNLMVRLERGLITQMSCGFIVSRDEWDDDYQQRTVQEFAELLDVSAVAFPASPTTSIAIARRMAADLRAGKVLSRPNQDKLLEAAKSLHAVLGAAGVDLSQLGDNDADDAVEPDVNVSPDGTTGGSDAPESGVGADGFPLDQTRSAEPGEPIQFHRSKAAVDQAWLDSLIEAGEGVHGSARKRAA